MYFLAFSDILHKYLPTQTMAICHMQTYLFQKYLPANLTSSHKTCHLPQYGCISHYKHKSACHLVFFMNKLF